MAEFTVAGLRMVREAARHGSFSVAAERLGYTQSAVSRQIAIMERAAGRALFERGARGVRLTTAGQVVVRRAEAVLAELDGVRQELGHLDGRAVGRLRIGGVSTTTAALVPRTIGVLIGQRPGLRVQLREGLSTGLLTALTGNRVDLVVIPRPQRLPKAVQIHPLLDDPLLVAVARGHLIAGMRSVSVEALRDEAWIAGSAEPDSTLLGAWADGSWQPRVRFVARDWFAKIGLVAAGLGITVVPGLAVPALPPSITVVRLDHPTAYRTTVVAYRPEFADDLRSACTDALADVTAELIGELRHRLRGQTP
jgi:DNA-binding transcriptional LysR family regulator